MYGNPAISEQQCPPGSMVRYRQNAQGQWVRYCEPIQQRGLAQQGQTCPPGTVRYVTPDGRTLCRPVSQPGTPHGLVGQGDTCPPGTLRQSTPDGRTICTPIHQQGFTPREEPCPPGFFRYQGICLEIPPVLPQPEDKECPPGTLRQSTPDGRTICTPIHQQGMARQTQGGACPTGYVRVCRDHGGVTVCTCEPIHVARGMAVSPSSPDMGFPSRRRARRRVQRNGVQTAWAYPRYRSYGY